MQPPEHFGFLFEAAQGVRVGCSWLDDLQCDPATGMLLLGFVDRPHAPFAQHLNDPVAANRVRKLRVPHDRRARVGWTRDNRVRQCVRDGGRRGTRVF